MNINEFEKVKDMNYFDYCEYLKEKYGEAKDYYMTKSFNKKPSITRTKEGLFCHHIMEYYVPKLSEKGVASHYPYEYQAPENLVYCDYLEHMLLHIMIDEQSEAIGTGIGGLVVFMIPQLNDFYCGVIPKPNWLANVRNKIINDKDVYLLLLTKLFEARYAVQDIDEEYSIFNFHLYQVIPEGVPLEKIKKWNKRHKHQIRYIFEDDIFDYICSSAITNYTGDITQDMNNASLYTEIFNLALPIIQKSLVKYAEKHNIKNNIEILKYDFYNRYVD